MRRPVGKGAWVALAAVVLATGTIGWRLVSDRSASQSATPGANDPLADAGVVPDLPAEAEVKVLDIPAAEPGPGDAR